MDTLAMNADTGEISRPHAKAQPRDTYQAIWRGLREKCPNCGEGALFRRYLKVNDCCPNCGEELYHQRADDAPPYFTMVIVGHVVVGGVWGLEDAYNPPFWVHGALWFPLTILMSLLLLPRIKGALVGFQWATRMHGFATSPTADLAPGHSNGPHKPSAQK
jgi:uncharacterized protein (DUF983 family)